MLFYFEIILEQLEILEAAFVHGQYPPGGVREKLALSTELTEARVQEVFEYALLKNKCNKLFRTK